MFAVVLGGPFGDGTRVLHAVSADDEETVRARLMTDHWHVDGHLRTSASSPGPCCSTAPPAV
jgi:hypothetical protein